MGRCQRERVPCDLLAVYDLRHSTIDGMYIDGMRNRRKCEEGMRVTGPR